MRIFPFKIRQNHTRWILIFGLLIGLFFSGGEGIQLLPFPVAEGSNSKNTSSILEKNLKSYVLSVHNSSNHSPLLKSKFQKNANQYLPGGHSTFDWSSIRAKLFLQQENNREKPNLSHASVFLSSQSDRAPPTV